MKHVILLAAGLLLLPFCGFAIILVDSSQPAIKDINAVSTFLAPALFSFGVGFGLIACVLIIFGFVGVINNNQLNKG